MYILEMLPDSLQKLMLKNYTESSRSARRILWVVSFGVMSEDGERVWGLEMEREMHGVGQVIEM